MVSFLGGHICQMNVFCIIIKSLWITVKLTKNATEMNFLKSLDNKLPDGKQIFG